MITMSAGISGVGLQDNTTDVLDIIIELFNLLRGIGFIVWYFYCNHLVKQRKVTMMEKLKKIFYPMIGFYFTLFLIEVIVAIIEIQNMKFEDASGDHHSAVTTWCIVLYIVYTCFLLSITYFYLKYINVYTESMKKFHLFLTTYRQTPRSRFIRKYQPGLEPLYEENSIFERSMVTT